MSRAKFEETETICSTCGKVRETGTGLMLVCKGPCPEPPDDSELSRVAVLLEGDGLIDINSVTTTKQRFSHC